MPSSLDRAQNVFAYSLLYRQAQPLCYTEAMADPARDHDEFATASWAAEHKLEYFDTRQIHDLGQLPNVLSQATITSYQALPLGANDTDITLGYTPQAQRSRLELLRKQLLPKNTHLKVISASGFAQIVKQLEHRDLWQTMTASPEQFAQLVEQTIGEKIFVYIAQYALRFGATDIHFEPKSNHVVVRCRIDSALTPIVSLARDRYQIMLSAIQISSKMSWGTDKPQSGRLSLTLLGADQTEHTVNIRLESVPTFNGEELVARLLNLNVSFLDLDKVGLRPPLLARLRAATEQTSGMIIVAGPTGSGKSSMLYAIIRSLDRPDIKIVTLEDPVEYNLANASQIPVHSDDKESFSAKFRAVMREDPDVIMVGEIRDLDTARTALQAALTGHLVLTTFHANSSAAAVTRLMDTMKDNPLMVSALQIIQAQRLIRRLCHKCQVEIPLSENQIATLQKFLTGIDAKYDLPKIEKVWVARGCGDCITGYRGRMIVAEQMTVSDTLKQLIIDQKDKLTASQLQATAVKGGMVTLAQDGVMRALAGATSLEEVRRSVGLPAELIELSNEVERLASSHSVEAAGGSGGSGGSELSEGSATK